MDELAIMRRNMRYLRRKNGYSQDFVATYFHKKSYTTIQKWESGDSEPSVANCVALCRLYNISLNELIYTDLEKAGK